VNLIQDSPEIKTLRKVVVLVIVENVTSRRSLAAIPWMLEFYAVAEYFSRGLVTDNPECYCLILISRIPHLG